MGAGFLALLAAPILDLTNTVPPLFDQLALRVAGLVIAVLAAAGILAAQIGLGASWRIGVDPNEHTELVSTGAFALVRNPIFTTMLAFAGLALAVPNLAGLAGLLLAITGVEWQVRAIEEPYLHKTHGTAYTQYATTTGRFLPGIGRLR